MNNSEKMIINALVYRNETRSLEKLDVLCKDGKIAELGELGTLKCDGEIIDAEGYTLYPGLVDIHTHGRAGYDFTEAPAEALPHMARSYAEHGVTTVMPTLASAPYERMLASAKLLNDFKPADGEATFCGVHFEGRYLNAKKKGAHAEHLLAPLNADELDNEILKSLKAFHISAAYELDSDGSFTRTALEMGATLGLGHTNATYAEAKTAERSGITAYTHLFNAMPALHHRDGGAVAACLEGDSFAELICDGIHISPEMVRLAYRNKGAERLSLISDSMEATGSPDGEYAIAGNKVIVKNGKALTLEGALAGSTLTLDGAVQNLMDFCGIPLTDAIICATEAPAREVGIFDKYGSIDAGKSADILFVPSGAKNFKIDKIMLRGSLINKE